MTNQGLLCGCGCGERIEIQDHHKYAGVPRFRHGHYARTAAAKEMYASRQSSIEPPNPSGFCMCGCGGRAPISATSSRKRQQKKGHPVRFLPGHHNRLLRGPSSPKWKGGRIVRRGYVLLHNPNHPRADSKGYIPEHQVVAEREAGRGLLPGEVVHHINGVKDDNRPDNLVILTQTAHRAEHAEEHGKLMRRYHEEHPDQASLAGTRGAAARWGKPD